MRKASSLPLIFKGEPETEAEATTEASGRQPGKWDKLRKAKGLIAMLLCVFFLDLARFFVKLAYQTNAHLSATEQAFGKFFAMLVLASFIALTSQQCHKTLCSMPRFLVKRFLIRCLLFTAVSMLQSFGILMLTYSTAVIISFTAPLLVPFSGFLILRQRITLCNIISLLVSFSGVIIFTNPGLFGQLNNASASSSSQQNSLLGILLMLGSAVARAFDITYMRLLNKAKLKNDISRQFLIEVKEDGQFQYQELEVDHSAFDQLTLIFYLSAVGTVVSALFFGGQEILYSSKQLGITSIYTVCLLFLSAALLIFSQMLYSIATKHEDVGKLAAMYYFQIVMAFVWEATVFHGNIGTSEIVGTAIILFTSIIVTLLKILG